MMTTLNSNLMAQLQTIFLAEVAALTIRPNLVSVYLILGGESLQAYVKCWQLRQQFAATRSRFPFSLFSARKRFVEVGQTINPTETTSSLRPFNEAQFVLGEVSELTKLGVLLKSSLKIRPDLDWALIEITAEELTISNAINLEQKRSMQPIIPTRQFSTIETDIEVATCTGSKHATVGVMSGSSTFLKMVHSDTFEEVKTVTLSGYLCR